MKRLRFHLIICFRKTKRRIRENVGKFVLINTYWMSYIYLTHLKTIVLPLLRTSDTLWELNFFYVRWWKLRATS